MRRQKDSQASFRLPTSDLRLLTSDLCPKIADFGLAKVLGADVGQTQSGAVVGTPSYMAPEQAAGQKDAVGPAADIYALGAILYELLTGRPPFRAATVVETAVLVQTAEAVSPRQLQPHLPRDLETICLKCLRKSTQRRYGSAADLADDLRRFLADEPILARRTPLVRKVAKWARRRPALAALSGATTIAVVTLLAVWLKFTADLRSLNIALKDQRDTATSLATVARDKQREAERQKAEAERRQALAIAALQHARSAARESYQLAYFDPDLRSRGLEPLRQKLLQESLQLQEKLLAEFGNVPELQREQADGYYSLAWLTQEFGQTAEALRLHRRAVAVAEQLTHAHPDNATYRGTLGTCLIGLADGLKRERQYEEAEAAFRRSIECFENLAARGAFSDEQVHLQLACAYDEFGIPLYDRGRMDECEAAKLAACNAIEEAIRRKGSPDVKLTNRHAIILNNLGFLYFKMDRVSKAEPLLVQAIELREELWDQSPDDPRYLDSLSVSYRNLALVYQKLRRDDKALELFNKAVELHLRLAEAHPRLLKYHTYLAKHCLLPLGDFHRNRQRPSDAAAAYHQAADLLSAVIRQAPGQWEHIDDLSVSLLRLASVSAPTETADLRDRLTAAIELAKPFLDRSDAADARRWRIAALEKARDRVPPNSSGKAPAP